LPLAELVFKRRGVGCVCELILAHNKLEARLILDRKTKFNVEEEYVSTPPSTNYWVNTTLHELLGQLYTPWTTGSTLHSMNYWVNSTLHELLGQLYTP
jgi:hypothetical protein